MKNQVKFPYGVSNAEKVMTENYVFIDKTPFVEQLEAFDSFVSFLRPRRAAAPKYGSSQPTAAGLPAKSRHQREIHGSWT